MTQERPYVIKTIRPADQNRLQSIAVQLARADKKIADGNAARTKLQGTFYRLLDNMFGEDSSVLFETRAPLEGHRLVREVAFSSRVDEESLLGSLTQDEVSVVAKRVDILKDVEAIRSLVPADVFAAITEQRLVLEYDKLEAARDLGLVDAEKIANATTVTPSPRLQLRKTGPSSKPKMMAGQVAVYSPASTQER